MDGLSPMPIAASKSKLPVRMRRGLEFLKRRNQRHMVLAGMFKPRDVQKKGLMQLMPSRHFHSCLLSLSRIKPFVVHAIVNHCNPFARQTEESHHVSSGILADGDDGVLPPGQPPRHYSPI